MRRGGEGRGNLRYPTDGGVNNYAFSADMD